MTIIIKIIVREIFDDRPFKFESYKTELKLEEAVRENFSEGSNLYEVVKILEKSGAKCSIDKSDEAGYAYIHKGARYIATCSYRADLFSLNPLITYRIILQTDENYKLIHSSAMRVGGFLVI